MSVIDHAKLSNYITNWIKDYVTKAGLKTLVLGLSGGIDSALVALLCKKTGLPMLAINMPCHSSDSAYNRAKVFADNYSIPLVKIDLSEAHNVIYGQAKDARHDNYNSENKIAVGGLRSCLRAPTLSYFANATRGIIVGTGNRSEDNLTRYYQKFGDGCVDLAPIADLFKSEVYELFAYLAAELAPQGANPTGESCYIRGLDATAMMFSAREILAAKPTADLWGPDSGQEDEKELGLTYEEIEWGDRENMRTIMTIEKQGKVDVQKTWGVGIISGDPDPSKHPSWMSYTGRQREIVAKLHQLEKVSRHKHNPALPVCEVRKLEGLVR